MTKKPFCPNCGEETNNAKFFPNCSSPQGTGKTPSSFQHRERKSERLNAWLGAILCCCCNPIMLFVYYYVTEPDEDSLNQTFTRIGILCFYVIGFIVLFTLFIMIDGRDLFGL
ncbi:MAG: hypothetical protein ACTSW1_10180 [Candidatus Hodarchaeales archaeon]